MDKALKIIMIAGIIIVAPAVVYYCVYLPSKKENTIKECSKEATRHDPLADITSKKTIFYESDYDSCLRKNGLIR